MRKTPEPPPWPLNSEVLHDMPFEQSIIDLEKDVNDKYKHLENNIAERTIYISEKDIEIFKNILKKNCAGGTALRYEMHPMIKLMEQVTK